MAACLFGRPDLKRHGQGRLSPEMICDARRVFENHLAAQGTSIHVFIDRVKQILSAPRFTLKAEPSGFFQIDLARLRDVLVPMQTIIGHNCFKDPAGVKLLAMPGEAVVADQPIATVRCDTSLDMLDVISRVESAFSTLADTSSSILSSVKLEQQMEAIYA
jgi:thymidine phosphorylase